MKKILIVFCILFSITSMAAIELRANLPKIVNAGELISTQAEIIKIEGDTKLSHLIGQTLDDSIYINKIGIIERNAEHPNGFVDLELVFLGDVKNIPLVSLDHSIKLYISNLKVNTVPESKDFILINWKLPFQLPWWIYLISIIFITGLGAFWFKYPQMKKRKLKLKKKHALWNQLLEATTEDEILKIWYSRNIYFQEFPDLESSFRSWESKVYPFFFKPEQSTEDKNQIKKLYVKFVTELPPRRDYGI